MAIYHLHVGTVSRRTGRSAVGAAAYRAGEKLYGEYDTVTHDYRENTNAVNAAAYRSGESLHNEQGNIVHDYTRKKGVVYSEIMLPEGAPREFADRGTLWNAVEKAEKRWDARTAREIDIALPVEFDRQEHIEVTRRYVQENFVDKGMVADFAIHDKGDGNPHAHVMLTTRFVDKDGFKGKNRDWNRREYLKQWRENWANICNEKFKEKGLDERIDHRTLKAQGIDREPTIHRGVAAEHMTRRGRDSYRVKQHNEIVERNKAQTPEKTAKYMHELKQDYISIDREINNLKQELTQAQQDMRDLKFKADEITERAENINTMQKRLEELAEKRRKMGISQTRQDIDDQIKRLERSHSQALTTFKREYNINPTQAETEAKRLTNQAKSKQHLHERLNDKLSPLAQDKNTLALKYQRQKLLNYINPDKQKIQDELSRLNKQNRPHERQSINEILTQERSIRELNTINEQNFKAILKDMKPQQAEKLIKSRETEQEREQSRGFSRGR